MKREVFTEGLQNCCVLGFPPLIHTKIKMHNEGFSSVRKEEPSRLIWASWVTEGSVFLLLKEKIATRETPRSRSLPVPQWHQAEPHSPHVQSDSPTALYLRVQALKCWCSAENHLQWAMVNHRFGFLQTLGILAARCFIVFPVTGEMLQSDWLSWTSVRSGDTGSCPKPWRHWYYLCRPVQWPRQLLWPGSSQLRR